MIRKESCKVNRMIQHASGKLVTVYLTDIIARPVTLVSSAGNLRECTEVTIERQSCKQFKNYSNSRQTNCQKYKCDDCFHATLSNSPNDS